MNLPSSEFPASSLARSVATFSGLVPVSASGARRAVIPPHLEATIRRPDPIQIPSRFFKCCKSKHDRVEAARHAAAECAAATASKTDVASR